MALQSYPLGRARGAFVDIAYAPDRRGPRAACVVSKKVEPLAAKRNTIRRCMKATLSALCVQEQTPLAFICIAKSAIRTASSAALARELERLVGAAVISYNTRT